MFTPVGNHTQITGLASAQTLTIATDANGAFLQAIGQNVRVTLDGVTTATASKGFQVVAGHPAVFYPLQAGAVLSIIQEAASATLEVQQARQWA